MPFARGDRVHLTGLGTGTVVDSRGARRYAIEIKGRIVVADERDLEAAAPARARGRRERASATGTPETRDDRRAPSVDLHGKTRVEALALVEQFINDALLAGRSEVHIIHGRGGGRVKAAVHAYLRQLSVVASFGIDPRNPGLTLVRFA
jgi:DNA mismatch repair protein MutS2